MGKTRGDVEFYDGTTNKSLVTELHRIDEALKRVAVYGVAIDLSNSNPGTSVTYTDDAVGFTPARGNNGNYVAGSLDELYPWNAIRPCLLKQGKVVGYLNKNDFSKFENGSSADITSGSSGDVMIEFPHFYYKISKVGTILYVKVSNVMQDGYTDWGFSYKGVIRDKFYVGAYTGCVSGSALRSLSGATIEGNRTIDSFRTAAQANGEGYEQMSFGKLTAIQVLYLLLFKSLDSQTALGRGYVKASGYHTTSGVTNTRGMNYGTNSDSSESDCIKLFGMEDFWGNKNIWIDGYTTVTGVTKIADGNFNNSADGYIQYLRTSSGSYSYFKDVEGDNFLAFSPKTDGGSATTYFCDSCYIIASNADKNYVPHFGGLYNDGTGAGAFRFKCDRSLVSAHDSYGARLTYCG